MSDKNFKVVRKSLHNVVKDILPTVLTMELVIEIRKQLAKQVSDTLSTLTKQITNRLDAMEQKQKLMHESLVRNVLAPAQNLPDNLVPKESSNTTAQA